MAAIELRQVGKSFGGVDVIKSIDLDIRHGEFMVFVGPSGCGKSTLLRLIAGLEEISAGEIYFDGVEVGDEPPAKRGIAMVFQSYALYPHMTVFNNLAFGMTLEKAASKANIRVRVEAAAEMLQLTPLLDRYPRQLSGGQRQRVAIGRAITRNPKVFLFDEPLSNLDAALRVATRIEIARLHKTLGSATMVYVTHDQVEAMTLADRICVLRDGRVEQVGTPDELYERPASMFVAGFIGSPKMNFLGAAFASPFGAPNVGVRAEDMSVVAEGGVWQGRVVHSENLGADSFVYVDIGSEDLVVVRESGRIRRPPGVTVNLEPDTTKLHRFDDTGRPIR